jgi:hypothetical protein
MTAFSQLNSILAIDGSENYWSDDLVLKSGELLRQFTDHDWIEIRKNWANRPAKWQHRCAYILSEGDAKSTIPILLAMIESIDDELVITAIDSFRSIEDEVPISTLSPQAMARVEEISRQNTLNKRIVKLLLHKLKRKY